MKMIPSIVFFGFLLGCTQIRALFPNRPQPHPFSPLLAYTFRQSECKLGTITEDATGGLNLTRSLASTSCPSRSGFTHAMIGVTLNDATDLYALRSSTPIGTNVLSAFTSDGGSGTVKQMSIEYWLTFTALPAVNVEATFLEIGNATDSTSTFGNTADTYQFRLTYKRSLTGVSFFLTYRIRNNALTSLTNTIEISSVNGDFVNGTFVETLQVNRLYVLIWTIQGDLITNNQATVFIGDASTKAYTTGTNPGVANAVRMFVFPSTQALRIGCSGNSNLLGIRADVHFVGLYSQLLSETNATALLAAGLPNSLPSVKNVSLYVQEDTLSRVLLNTTSVWMDVDAGNTLAFAVLNTVPGVGTLSITPFGSVHAGSVYSDVSSLSYLQSVPNVFSVATNTTACVTPYTNLTLQASDGIYDHSSTMVTDVNGHSTTTSIVSLCLVDTPDAPNALNYTAIPSVRVGSTRVFTLTFQDDDDGRVGLSDGAVSAYRMRELNGTIVSWAKITFYQTKGTYGELSFYDGISCTNLSVMANVTYFVSLFTTRSPDFIYCYLVYDTTSNTNTSLIGRDVFSYSFQDAAGSGAIGYAYFDVTTPLETCPVNPTVSLATLQTIQGGVDGNSCTSRGYENSSIPIYLQGMDSIPNRTMTFRIDQLPLYGTLYRVTAGGGQGSAVTVGVEDIPITAPNLWYVPQAYYFNRIYPSTFVNGLGLGLDGCRAPGATSCRCPNTTVSGCPDTFRYSIRVSSPVVSYSPSSIYRVYVDSNVTRPLSLLAPPSVFAIVATALAFTDTTAIQLVDVDDDVYPIGIQLEVRALVKVTDKGKLRIDQVVNYALHIDECFDALEVGCDLIRFYGFPSQVNTALSALQYTTTNKIGNQSCIMEINLYKPWPLGVVNSVYGDSILMRRIFLSSDAASADTGAVSLTNALIAGVAAVIFIMAMAACFAIKFCVKQTKEVVHEAHRLSVDFRARKSSGAVSSTSSRALVATHHPPHESRPHSTGEKKGAPSIFEYEKHIDKQTGQIYYYNARTGESSWDPPSFVMSRSKEGK
jgi:hypothetical protein